MTRDQVISIIGNRLAFRTEADMNDYILDELDLAQSDVLESDPFLPWFLRVEDSIVLNEGDDAFTLPTDFLRFSEEDGIFVVDSEGKRIQEVIISDAADARRHFVDTTEKSIPQLIAAIGWNDYKFFPKAAETYTINYTYYKREPAISSLQGSATNKWLTQAPYVVIGQVGMACAEVLRDGDAFKFFQSHWTQAHAKLEARDMERRLSGQALRF